MTTYDQSDFEQIATAIGIARVAQHKNLFEAAALWYRLGQRRPNRIAPSKLCEKLDRVAKNARRLLKSLGVNDLDEAPDGPGDPEIINALVLLGEPNEDPVIKATQRIARLAEIIDGVTAAADLERCAKRATNEVTEIGKLTVREGNPGDDRAGPVCLNNISASISGASAGVRLPSGVAAG